MVANIVIGTPLVSPEDLIALNHDDWENNEKCQTLFTSERFLPAIMKEAGLVKSTNEVRRNQPALVITLDKIDCFWLKWGKKKLYIIVGQ